MRRMMRTLPMMMRKIKSTKTTNIMRKRRR